MEVYRQTAVETASTETKPACAGYEILGFLLVRAPSGLGLCSRDFQSPRLAVETASTVRLRRYE